MQVFPAVDTKPYVDQIIADRRRLHRRPEVGWTEFETTYFVVERLKKIGIFSIEMGRAIIDPHSALGRDEETVKRAQKRALEHGVPQEFLDALDGYTGAIATFDSGRPGKTLALRFDIDALPVHESCEDAHLPTHEGFASEREGFMHACGHDGHTSVGLAVAQWIKDNMDSIDGRIKIVFQPAEEGVRGAAAVAASGKIDDADYFLSSHVGTEAREGEVKVLRNGFLATTKFDVYFEGRSAHAGSEPEKGRSALSAACACVLAMQGVPRHGEGDSRIAIGTMIAGEGRNVVPCHAKIEMEVRGATTQVNQFMADECCRLIEGISAGYGVKPTIVKTGDAAVYECDDECVDVLLNSAKAVPGLKLVTEYSTTKGSEDASMLAKRVREHGGKAGFFIFGCNHKGHHRADFDIQDTKSLPVGFAVMTGAIERLMFH